MLTSLTFPIHTWPQSPFMYSTLKHCQFWNTPGKWHSKAMGHRTDTYWTEIIILRRPVSWGTAGEFEDKLGWVANEMPGARREGMKKGGPQNVKCEGVNTCLFPRDLGSGYQPRLSSSLLEPHSAQWAFVTTGLVSAPSLSSPPWNLSSIFPLL